MTSVPTVPAHKGQLLLQVCGGAKWHVYGGHLYMGSLDTLQADGSHVHTKGKQL